jgi:signal transduction histidine kinase
MLLGVSWLLMRGHLRRTLALPDADAALASLAVQYAIALVGMLLVAGGVGWLLARRALGPVDEMTRFARRISEDRLDERLGPSGPSDELRELGETLDAMLDRLQGAFDAQRRFLANASHELRTPLAVIRAEAEVALANPEPDVDELREVAVAVSESAVRTEALLDSLMLLARSQPGLLRPERLDLRDVARRVAAQLGGEARSRGIDVHLAGEGAPASGDRALVERLVANLAENGVRHNLAGGWVELVTLRREDRAVVRVSNSGPDVAPELVGRMTAPFDRLGRHGGAPGAGLGLSIVQAVADAHRATLTITPRPQGGLVAEVAFLAATHDIE